MTGAGGTPPGMGATPAAAGASEAACADATHASHEAAYDAIAEARDKATGKAAHERTREAALDAPEARETRETPDPGVWPIPLSEGWQCVSTPAGACATPADLPRDGWLDAPVPGTVASASRAAGRLDIGAGLHERTPPAFAFDDHWYRLTLTGHGKERLRLHGLATLTEVWLDGTLLLTSDSMFERHDLDVTLDGRATLALCFRALTPLLEARRTRARWRPRLVSPATLRNVRTTLLGHMPGWCPSVQPVGPWRPVERLAATPRAFDTVRLAPRREGDDGVLALTLTFVQPQPASSQTSSAATLVCAGAETSLAWRDAHTLTGTLRVPGVEPWWPHTHGKPTLHAVTLDLDGTSIALGHVGFRAIEVDRGADGEGFALRVNGTPVFCRGACWTSADLATLAGTPAQLAHAFALARDAGMNMLRVGGTMVYESDAFYRLADEHGILIWQDFAFANFDYPRDDAFLASVQREATQFLERTQRFASLAVLCGGSEVDQQAAMFGLPPAMREQPLFTERLPALVAALRPDVPYVPNSPTGGTWPFSTRTGITHYYGVGAYQRPLDDVRRAHVRFAAECLAFANVPDDATLHAAGGMQPYDARWKAAVPRDAGAGWDFDDVREHYLRTLYGIDPARLRYEDAARYLELSRAVVAELMTDVFAEWRRHGSPCGGALVWQFQDLQPGAGWGVIDSTGRPKSVWHALAAALRPVQIAITDEGLNGLDLHVVNETAQPLHARLALVCVRDGSVRVAAGELMLEVPARGTLRVEAAACLGQFFDFTHAYRFGPPSHDVTIATLTDAASGEVLAEAFHLPDRSPAPRYDPGLTVTPVEGPDGWQLVIETQRFARFVHVTDAHYRAACDWFHLAPGSRRVVDLLALTATPGAHSASPASLCTKETAPAPAGEVRAINAPAPVFYG